MEYLNELFSSAVQNLDIAKNKIGSDSVVENTKLQKYMEV